MRSLIEQYIVTAAVQKGDTALAGAATPAETQAVEPRAAERAAQPRDARTPKAAATYSIASASSRIVQSSTGQTADAQAGRARRAPAPDPAPTAAASAQAASAGDSASDPIKPILVKTVKVRLAPSEAAAFAMPHGVSPPGPPAPPPPPAAALPAASPQIVAALSPEPRHADARMAQGAVGAQSPPQDRGIPLPKQARAEKPAMPVMAVAPWPLAEAQRESAPAALPAAAPLLPPPAASSTPPHNARPQSAALHSGWIIQVGAFEAEGEAKQKLSAVQATTSILSHADPFTEPVVKGDKTLYRARFAGLQKNEAEAVCKQLKRNDIDCMTIKN
jgi:D-alanyl-D-alanine carboxypeptidase